MLEILEKYFLPKKMINFEYENNRNKMYPLGLSECRQYCDSIQSIFPMIDDHQQVLDVFKNEHRKITESTQKEKNTTFSWARDHRNMFSN